jgi:hypothetical protein
MLRDIWLVMRNLAWIAIGIMQPVLHLGRGKQRQGAR